MADYLTSPEFLEFKKKWTSPSTPVTPAPTLYSIDTDALLNYSNSLFPETNFTLDQMKELAPNLQNLQLQESQDRLNEALFYSKATSTSPKAAYMNLEAVRTQYWGEYDIPQNPWKYISDSFKVSGERIKLAENAYSLIFDSGNEDLLNEIISSSQKVSEPSKIGQPWWSKWIGMVADLLPFTLSVIPSGVAGAAGGAATGAAIASAVGAPTLGGSIVAGAATGATYGFAAGSFAKSFQLTTGMAIQDLVTTPVKGGTEPYINTIADPEEKKAAINRILGFSAATGVLSAAIETLQTATLMGPAMPSVIKAANKAVAKFVETKGKKYGLSILAGLVKTTLSETGQELAQESIEFAGSEIAKESLSYLNEQFMTSAREELEGAVQRGEISRNDFNDYLKQMQEVMKTSLAAFPVMGAPGVILDYMANVSKNPAFDESFNAAFEKTATSKTVPIESIFISPTQQDTAIEPASGKLKPVDAVEVSPGQYKPLDRTSIFQAMAAGQAKAEVEVVEIPNATEEDYQKADTSTYEEEINRLADDLGGKYKDISDVNNIDTSSPEVFSAEIQVPDMEEAKSFIEDTLDLWKVSEEIKDGNTTKQDFLVKIGQDYTKITLSDNVRGAVSPDKALADDSRLAEAQRIQAQKPGYDKTTAEAYRDNYLKRMNRAFPNVGRRGNLTGFAFVDAMASTYLQEEGGQFMARILDPRIALKDEEFAYELPAGVKAAAAFKDGKALLVSTRYSDFSSVIHEWGHIFRENLKPSDLSVLEKFFGVQNGQWDTPQEEAFTEALSQFIYSGKFSSDTDEVLGKIRDMLEVAFKDLEETQAVEMTQEVIDTFNSLFTPAEESSLDYIAPAEEQAAEFDRLLFSTMSLEEQKKLALDFQKAGNLKAYEEQQIIPHEQEVREAVEAGIPVQEKILREFRDREWAQPALARLEEIKSMEFLKDEARRYQTEEDFYNATVRAGRNADTFTGLRETALSYGTREEFVSEMMDGLQELFTDDGDFQKFIDSEENLEEAYGQIWDRFNNPLDKAFSEMLSGMTDIEKEQYVADIWRQANMLTEEEANQAFLDSIKTDDQLKTELRRAGSLWKQWGGKSTFLGGNLGAAILKSRGNPEFSKTFLNKVRAEIENDPLRAREMLYTSSEDQIAQAQVKSDRLARALGRIEPLKKLSNASLEDRAALLADRDIRNPEVRKALLAGKIDEQGIIKLERAIDKEKARYERDQEKLIAGYEKEIKKLQKEKTEKADEDRARIASRDKKIKELQDKVKETRIETAKEVRRKNKEKRILREQRNKAIKLIARPVSKSGDVEFNRAIRWIQNIVDPVNKKPLTESSKKRFQGFFDKYPEAKAIFPSEYIEKLKNDATEEYVTSTGKAQTKSFRSKLTNAELFDLAERVKALRAMGAMTAATKQLSRNAELADISARMMQKLFPKGRDTVFYGTKESKETDIQKLFRLAQVSFVRPNREFKLLDGGVEDVFYNFMYRRTNEIYDKHLRNTGKRREALLKMMQDKKITRQNWNKDIKKTFPGKEITVTRQDALGMYLASKNERARDALIRGNFQDNQNAEEIFTAFVDDLSAEEKAVGDWMSQDFENHWDEMAATFERYSNAELGAEDYYFPMIRMFVNGIAHAESEAADLISGHSPGGTIYTEKGFTKGRTRQGERQSPIRLDAIDIYLEQMPKHDWFTVAAEHIKDMQNINREISQPLRERYGSHAAKWFKKYINDVADPTLYKQQDNFSKVSRMFRKNLATAALSYNIGTVLKQAPSLALYLGRVGPGRLMQSLGMYMGKAKYYENMVAELDPQMKYRAIDRVMEELRENEGKKSEAGKAIYRFGQFGMKFISDMDRAVTTVGWLAVYNKALADGKTQEEAIFEAQKATLETQPAARPKDLAQVSRENEALNWIMLFTNQLNQIFNIMRYDIPMAFRRGEYLSAGGMAAGILISTMAMTVLSGWRPGDDEEPFVKGMAEQMLNYVPVVGREAVSALQGWSGDNSPLSSIGTFVRAGKAVKKVIDKETDPEAALKKFYDLGIVLMETTGIPTKPARAARGVLEEGNLTGADRLLQGWNNE